MQKLVEQVAAIGEEQRTEVALRRQIVQALRDLEGQRFIDEELCGIAKQALEKRTEDAERKAEDAERKAKIAEKKVEDANRKT